jgi:hypothetical protein
LNVHLPHPPHDGYQTKQESIAVQGVPNLVIRSLLNKQQFHDPRNAALDLGISSAFFLSILAFLVSLKLGLIFAIK